MNGLLQKLKNQKNQEKRTNKKYSSAFRFIK